MVVKISNYIILGDLLQAVIEFNASSFDFSCSTEINENTIVDCLCEIQNCNN